MELTRNTYEEYFLLYVDNELSQADRAAVEKFAAKHPDLLRELNDLKKTVLTLPEEVVFEHKETLYRKEEARIVVFPWWRALAAAVILLFLGTTTWLLIIMPSKKVSNDAVALNQSSRTNKSSDTSLGLASNNKPRNKAGDRISNEKTIAQNEPAKRTSVKTNSTKQSRRPVASNAGSDFTPPWRGQEDAKQDDLKPLSDEQLITKANTDVGQSNFNIAIPVSGREVQGAQQQNKEDKGELYAADEPRDNVIYIANLAVKKSTFRGAFRKASRIFGKVTTMNAPPKEEVAMLKQ